MLLKSHFKLLVIVYFYTLTPQIFACEVSENNDEMPSPELILQLKEEHNNLQHKINLVESVIINSEKLALPIDNTLKFIQKRGSIIHTFYDLLIDLSEQNEELANKVAGAMQYLDNETFEDLILQTVGQPFEDRIKTILHFEYSSESSHEDSEEKLILS